MRNKPMRQSTMNCAIYKAILLLIIILVLMLLSGCATVKRPDALICGVNAKGMKLRCYNIKLDFNDDGTRKPGAIPSDIKIKSVHDLNGGIYFSPGDFEKLKVWLSDMREYAKEHCQ
jgi:hypothetical protein